MWDSVLTIVMIKRKHINPYISKLISNKFKYIIVSGPYNIAHEVKVPFRMTEISSSKIITPHFHVYNAEDDAGISYDMVIGCDLMVQLGLKSNFGH